MKYLKIIKKIISEKEGIYVWNKIKDNSTNNRIGRSTNIYSRLNDHNSSNIDKIVPKLIVYVNYSDIVEHMLKFCLEKHLYRGEFYTCDIKSIEKTIIIICKFLKKQNCSFNFNKKNVHRLDIYLAELLFVQYYQY